MSMFAKTNRELETELRKLKYELDFRKKLTDQAWDELRALMDHLGVYVVDIPATRQKKVIMERIRK